MRVLHLFDTSDASLPYTRLALLAQSLGRLQGVSQDLCLLGNRDLADAAGQLGLVPRWRVPVTQKKAVFAYFSFRQILRNQQYDLIHCWSGDPGGTATLAMLAAPRLPRVVTLTQQPALRLSHWARMLTAEHATAATTYLPISNTIARELLTHGVKPQAVHVLRPGIDMSLVARDQRLSLRAAWGLKPDSSRLIVALIGDPPETADGIEANMAVGVANQVLAPRGIPLSLLVHPRQKNAGLAMAAGRQLGLEDMVILDGRIARPWALLPGCDIALAIGSHAGGLSLLWAMAASVPIVGQATYAISEVVEDRHSALLARPNSTRALSHRITQLATDAQLAWKLKDTARHEAYSLFSRQRYAQSLLGVYQQVSAGQPIEIPELPVTGGLRFSGRA